MKKIYFLFSIVLQIGLAIDATAAEESIVVLNANLDPISPGFATRYLRDENNALTLEDVISAEFSALENGEIDFGFTADKFWLHFSVLNESSATIRPLLRTSARFMRPLEIYLVRASGDSELLLYNDETLDFHNRPLPEFRFLATEFELAANENADFYIKFGAGGQAAMSFVISDREPAVVEQWQSTVSAVLFAGVLLTLILVNLFHYIAVREKPYLVYVIYESLNLLYVCHMDGHTFQYIWPSLPWWNDDATPMLAAAALVGGNLFVAVFLDAKRHAPMFYKIFIGSAVVSAAMLLLTVFFGNRVGNVLTAPMLPFGLLMSVIAAIIALRKGHYPARYFIVAFSLFLVSATIWSGTILGLFTTDLNTLVVHKTTVAIQALILSMGLADQVRRINQEYNRTQAELITNLEGRLEDARERMHLERENEKAMQQLLDKSKQLATTSHDVNQPIQSLRLALKALQTQSNTENTAHLERTLDHMESILGGALDEASEDLKHSNEQAPVRSLVVGNLIEEVVERFSEQAAEKCLKLKAFSSNAVIVTHVLPLQRCLGNLVSNAIVHTENGGILVGARRRGDMLNLQVIDSGKGISEEDKARITDPLNKSANSPGHGLGLAIVSEICEEYGWTFSVASSPDKGSCFSVAIPVRA